MENCLDMHIAFAVTSDEKESSYKCKKKDGLFNLAPLVIAIKKVYFQKHAEFKYLDLVCVAHDICYHYIGHFFIYIETCRQE